MESDVECSSYIVDTEEKLRSLYPGTRYLPVLEEMDRTAIKFIEHSPLIMVGAYNPDLGIEVSPRGDEPGFVKVLDSKTLIIPDRAGNHRLDCMTGLLTQNEIGIFFLIPGLLETLRIKGEATITCDPEVLEMFREKNGRLPRTAIVVKVYESFFHCGKALNRSRLWNGTYNLNHETWKLMRGTLENSMSTSFDLNDDI